MKIAPIVALFVVPFAVSAVTVSYDPIYDDGSQPLSETPCSDVLGGMGYQFFRDVPTFPHISGSPLVQSSNPADCGSSCFVEFEFLTEARDSLYNR